MLGVAVGTGVAVDRSEEVGFAVDD